MQRRTITLPDDLGAEIDRLVESGAVASVSRFFQDAARGHLANLSARTPRSAASVRRRTPQRSPWRRLG
ncbi:MAG TPA: hypothetical protein VI916_12085 [Acidimicrobiia bacterium]|nr:hypothetical protein [Acidimicrobiia bacterium]